MRRWLGRIVNVLDGTPVVEGRLSAGQSVVELALITPILIVLLAGLVEVGWFANNYLTLMDITRSGARRGATLQGDLSVINFAASYRLSTPMLTTALPADFQTRQIGTTPYNTEPTFPYSVTAQQAARSRFRQCNDGGERAFYNEIACLMLTSFAPLIFDATNGVDDIIISGFGLQVVDPSQNTDPATTPPWLGSDRPIPGDVPQVVVVSRFPSGNNECDVIADGTDNPVLTPLEPRDPFDFNQNNQVDYTTNYIGGVPGGGLSTIVNDDFTEVWGNVLDGTNAVWGYDPAGLTLETREKQVGFTWTGNHRIEGTYCIGSEWRTQEIEQMFNLNNFIQISGERSLLPSQGLVLVEMYWQHKLLLNLPFFSILEDQAQVNVWAAFPMTAARPSIVFQ